MQTFTVAITRVSYYEVPALDEDQAIDLALEGGNDVQDVGGETTSAVVTAVDGVAR